MYSGNRSLNDTITHSNTSDAATGVNDPNYDLRQPPASKPTGTPPQYQIYDIGVVQAGDEASQGFGVSPAGIAVGRSLSNDGSQAFSWTLKVVLSGCRTWPVAVTAYLTARTTVASSLALAPLLLLARAGYR